MNQLGLHSFNLKYTEVEPGLLLPDLADLLLQRLNNTRPLQFEHDLSAIGQNAVRQIEETRGKQKLRLSRSGGCVRHLSYIAHDVPPASRENWDPSVIDAGSRLTFTIGDVTESVLNAALQEVIAESNLLTLADAGAEQVEVTMSVDGTDIHGHPDGFMLVPAMRNGLGLSKMIRCLWEVKSMADYGFRKFQDEGMTPNDSYWWQTQAYMGSENSRDDIEVSDLVDWAYIIGYGKTTTARDVRFHEDGSWEKKPPLHGQWIKFDHNAFESIEDKFRTAMSVHPEDIARPYGPKTGKRNAGQLGFPCGWCSHAFNCFPDATAEATKGGFYVRNNKVVLHANQEEK
jgi:hypothetical protein